MADAAGLATWLSTLNCEQESRDGTEASDAMALLLLNSTAKASLLWVGLAASAEIASPDT